MIEEALPFTVYRTMLTANGCLLLQGRGLLQMKDGFWTGSILDGSSKFVENLHLELMFVKVENPDNETRRKYDQYGDYSKKQIFFRQIESVFFKRGLIISKLVFKLRPEQIFTLLNIDPIKREIVLSISRQDRELAKRFESAITMEISNEKLKKLLKDIEQT